MAELPFFVWNGSPEIVTIGPFVLRWYGLLFATSFLAGFFIVRWMFRLEGKPEHHLDPLLIYMLAATVIGARLGHVLFYEPTFYLSNPLAILRVWEGGLASHGGAIGIFTGLYLYSRKRPDQPYLWLLDRLAVPTALAGCFIRLGNFFNSEIIGEPTEVAWAVVFARVDGLARHPAQLYESVSYLLIFGVLLLVYRHYKAKTPRGLLIGLFLLLVFGARFAIEFVKIPQAAFEATWTLQMGQWLSLPLVLVGLGMVGNALRAGKKG